MLMLREAARRNHVWIIGGTVAEKAGCKLYNTCAVFNSQGDIVAKYRKVSDFDVPIQSSVILIQTDASI